MLAALARRQDRSQLAEGPKGGGSGGSGIDLVKNIDGFASTKLMANYDIVGCDPRGVGESSPIEFCVGCLRWGGR